MPEIDFPRLYAAYVSQFTEDLPFWQHLATSSNGPVLELGCGPGRVLHHLAKRGFQSTGLDNDRGMIEWARSHIPPPLATQIELVHADMRAFTLPDRYPLIIIPCNTFAYFGESETLQILENVRRHLTPNGEAAIVIPNAEGNRLFEAFPGDGPLETEPDYQFLEPISNHPVQVYAQHQFEPEGKVLHVSWSFDELFPDGKVQRMIHEITYHLRSVEETARLLTLSGLKFTGVYGDYSCKPLDPDSHELTLLAEAKG